MEAELLALSAVVLAASALQSATGIGFGIIAGPLFLVALNDASAIQISILLNLLIAVLLAPSLRARIDRGVLAMLSIGVLLGSPLGLLIYLALDVAALKLAAAVAVSFALLMLVRSGAAAVPTARRETGGVERAVVGVVAGAMGGSLAMPGPVPAAWMAARGYDKDRVRATILAMFVVAYAVALVLQYALAEVSRATLMQSAALAPATVAGVVLGHALARRISQRSFRRIVVAVLALTIALLLLTIRR